jgi:putative FmdB family regulatory protein
MPTYIYFCEHHKEFEITHSIKDELTECPKCAEEGKNLQPVKRLIAPTSFILAGGGWAKEGYSSK